MRRRKGETMNNIKLKTNLENNQDEWKNFEEKEFSLDFLNIGNKVAFFIIIFFFTIMIIATFKIKAETVDDLPVVVQELVPPPFVPVHNQVADAHIFFVYLHSL